MRVLLAFQFECKQRGIRLIGNMCARRMSLQSDKLVHMRDNCIHFDSILFFRTQLSIGYLIYILIKYTQR